MVLFSAASVIPVQAAEFVKTTHVFKTVGDVKIEADVYRADDEVVRPVVVWLHGGALIVGGREGIFDRIRDLCQDEGWVFVSLDYRLAPETKLPEIFADVEDAFRWLHSEGPVKLHIDPRRMIVTGGSAGGYLTMLVGAHVRPRPLALVAYWGYGDIDGPWMTKPSEDYLKQPHISKAEALAAVGQGVPTGTRDAETQKTRGKYYHYLRQQGAWAQEVTGFDPAAEPRKFDRYCPIRHIDSDYPPVFMIHGTIDFDVPYEQSANMAKELAKHNVDHTLFTVPNAGHGLAGGDKDLVVRGHQQALDFIRQRLKK